MTVEPGIRKLTWENRLFDCFSSTITILGEPLIACGAGPRFWSIQLLWKETRSLKTASRQPYSSRWFLCARKSPYALLPVSHTFPQLCVWNSSNVRLIDDGPQGRSSTASSFHASLLQAMDGVVSLALCQQVVSQAPQHFRASEKQTCEGWFARQSTCSVGIR